MSPESGLAAVTNTPDVIAPSHILSCALWLPRPPEDVLGFFSDAFNLEELTPGFLAFAVLTPPPILMAEGTLIDYRIRLRGLPMRWRTRISEWHPGRGFVDEQLKGPYSLWRHEHRFAPSEGGTVCTDRVAYRAPGGRLVHRLFVEPDLLRIFRFRQARMLERFGLAGRPGRELEAPSIRTVS